MRRKEAPRRIRTQKCYRKTLQPIENQKGSLSSRSLNRQFLKLGVGWSPLVKLTSGTLKGDLVKLISAVQKHMPKNKSLLSYLEKVKDHNSWKAKTLLPVACYTAREQLIHGYRKALRALFKRRAELQDLGAELTHFCARVCPNIYSHVQAYPRIAKAMQGEILQR